MRVRRVLGWMAALVVLGLVAVPATIAILAWRQPDRISLPLPTGAYAVGRLTFDWRDDARIDPFAPASGTVRELPVWIWYPAERQSGAARAEYMPALLTLAEN